STPRHGYDELGVPWKPRAQLGPRTQLEVREVEARRDHTAHERPTPACPDPRAKDPARLHDRERLLAPGARNRAHPFHLEASALIEHKDLERVAAEEEPHLVARDPMQRRERVRREQKIDRRRRGPVPAEPRWQRLVRQDERRAIELAIETTF